METNTEELLNIKKTIENMSVKNHNEILKILLDNNCEYSENSNGTFINLSRVNKEIIELIKQHIDHINNIENNLITVENKKNIIKQNINIVN